MAQNILNIVLWNAPFLKIVEYGLNRTAGMNVRTAGVTDALTELANGRADAALIPSDIALMASESLDILPAVAISTWANPYVNLTLPDGFLGGDLVLSNTPDSALTAFVSTVVLKEHYGIHAAVAETADESRDRSPHEVVTIRSSEPAGDAEPRVLDLGREWFELVNCPMVWALFVARKGEASAELIQRLRTELIDIDDNRRDLAHALSDDESYIRFCLNEMRYRLDDLATASLTSLAEYLYFYGKTDQVPAVQYASLPDESEENEGARA